MDGAALLNLAWLLVTLSVGIATVRLMHKNNTLQEKLATQQRELAKQQRELAEKQEELAQKGLELQRVRTANERRLEALREFGRKSRQIEWTYVDVFLFGPRDSGKTSIVKLWTMPWVEIIDIASSDTWERYEADLHESDAVTRYDPLFEVERIYVPTLRMRVWDYPGEGRFRVEAVRQLGRLNHRAVILLLFKVGFENGQIVGATENAKYYSTLFLDEIRTHLTSVSGAVAKAVIVFSKVDLLPPAWTSQEARAALIAANTRTVDEVERLFSGNLAVQLTSADTNEGLIDLLGIIGKTAIPTQTEQQRYDERLRRLQREQAQAGEHPRAP